MGTGLQGTVCPAVAVQLCVSTTHVCVRLLKLPAHSLALCRVWRQCLQSCVTAVGSSCRDLALLMLVCSSLFLTPPQAVICVWAAAAAAAAHLYTVLFVQGTVRTQSWVEAKVCGSQAAAQAKGLPGSLSA